MYPDLLRAPRRHRFSVAAEDFAPSPPGPPADRTGGEDPPNETADPGPTAAQILRGELARALTEAKGLVPPTAAASTGAPASGAPRPTPPVPGSATLPPVTLPRPTWRDADGQPLAPPDLTLQNRQRRQTDLVTLFSAIPAAAGLALGPSSGLGSILLGAGQGGVAAGSRMSAEAQAAMQRRADAYIRQMGEAQRFYRGIDVREAEMNAERERDAVKRAWAIEDREAGFANTAARDERDALETAAAAALGAGNVAEYVRLAEALGVDAETAEGIAEQTAARVRAADQRAARAATVAERNAATSERQAAIAAGRLALSQRTAAQGARPAGGGSGGKSARERDLAYLRGVVQAYGSTSVAAEQARAWYRTQHPDAFETGDDGEQPAAVTPPTGAPLPPARSAALDAVRGSARALTPGGHDLNNPATVSRLRAQGYTMEEITAARREATGF